MSKLDIRLEGRVAVLKVRQILELRKNGAAGLPEMDILDDQGKKHTISAVDLSTSEFEKIKPGTTIQVRVQENWANLTVLS